MNCWNVEKLNIEKWAYGMENDLCKMEMKNEDVHNTASNPPPPPYISATCSEQDCAPKSKHNSSTSSPKMTEKQNNHQASNLGLLINSVINNFPNIISIPVV